MSQPSAHQARLHFSDLSNFIESLCKELEGFSESCEYLDWILDFRGDGYRGAYRYQAMTIRKFKEDLESFNSVVVKKGLNYRQAVRLDKLAQTVNLS